MQQDLRSVYERLSGLESPAEPVLSVYLNIGPTGWSSVRPRIRDLLRPVEDLVDSRQLGHDASMALRKATNRLEEMSAELERDQHPAVAMFLCQSLELEERIELPRPVWDNAVVGPAPYLRPLQALLDEFRRIIVVVLDTQRAEIDLFHMGESRQHTVIEGEEIRKANLAGWHGLEELRHLHHAEEARHHLLREVAARVRTMAADFEARLVLIGGQSEITNDLLGFLDPGIQEIAETFVIDLHTLTPSLLASKVSELERDYEEREEAALVDEIYSLFAAGEQGVVGVERTVEAANQRAVAQLLINDGVAQAGWVCTRCEALAISERACRVCGGPVEPVPELFEALARAVVAAGGTVEHVLTKTALAQDLVAARLHFVPWVKPARAGEPPR
jgi:peptide chain release factor subunit 1